MQPQLGNFSNDRYYDANCKYSKTQYRRKGLDIFAAKFVTNSYQSLV